MLNHYLGYLIVYFAGAVVAFSVPAWALGVPMWAFTKGVFAGAWVGAAWFGTRDAFRNGLI